MPKAVLIFMLALSAILLTMTHPLSAQSSEASPASRASQASPPPLQWHRLADMPAGVFSAGSSVTGRQAVITGGLNQAGQASTLIQVLDLDTLQWRLADIQIPVGVAYHTQLTLADGRIMIAGGKSGDLLNGLKTAALTWIIAADLQTLTRGPDLPTATDNFTAHLLPSGQAVFIAGRQAVVFDPSSATFTQRIDLRESRREHASAVLPDGRILVAGGISRRSMELLDIPRRISVMLAPRFDQPIDDLSAAALPDGRVLLLGGQNSHSGNTLDHCLVVDLSNPARATLTPSQPLGITGGASDLAVATLGRWIIAVGGETQQNNQDAELATARIIDSISLKAWSLPDMIVAHDDAQIIADGRSVIVVGGYSVSTIRIGPLTTKMPTAVHVVERLILPEHRLSGPGGEPIEAGQSLTP